MRRIKVLLLAALLIQSAAYAQFEWVDTFSDFGDQLAQWCPVAENFNLGGDVSGAIGWVCSMRPAIDRATDLVDGFIGDVNGFFERGLSDTFAVIGDATGLNVGGMDLGALLSEARGTIRSGSFSVTSLAGQIMARINQKTFEELTAAPDAGATDAEKRIVNAIRGDPRQMAKELGAMGMRSDEVMRNASSQDLSNSARMLAASSLARGDEEQLLKRVTNPDPTNLTAKGTADTAQDLGTDAVSTRAAVQALVNAQADLMRQEAVSTGNLVTAVKEQALQQTFTTQQLSLLAQSLSNDSLREFDRWRDEYYDEMAQEAAAAEGLRGNYLSAAALLSADGKVGP